jgi:hypothetical protein
MERCDRADRYSGKKPPTCDDGDGCVACWKKRHEWIDAHRPPMSRDFKEFLDYIHVQKRLLQVGRFKSEDFPMKGSVYAMLRTLETLIRSGRYRHDLEMLRLTLKHVSEPPRPGKKLRLPMATAARAKST